MPAAFWENRNDTTVQCTLCRHACVLGNGKVGMCGVRANKNGVLYSLVMNNVAAAGLDPVEKKPLYHFRPSSLTYSFGTAGCNFACKFCQNYTISRMPADQGVIPGRKLSADTLLREALRHKAKSISFTYTEPTIFYELMYEVAGKALAEGLECILVSNGYQSLECLSSLTHRIKAANIDLKSMRESFYKEYCNAKLQPVLDNLKLMKYMGWWFEITTLLIPGLNDSDEELRDAARFIYQELGPHVPWHISRFHGAYRLQTLPVTPDASLERAKAIGMDEGLHYVYIGNAAHMRGASTHCPDCGTLCLSREGFKTQNKLKEGCCPKCKRAIEGVWGKL